MNLKYLSILSYSAISKFSFNGIRAFLVLFLINQLGLKEEYAYQIYAGAIALVYIVPIVVGWAVDKGLDLMFLLTLSVIAMLSGCFALLIESDMFLSLSLFVLADGIKRSTLPLLLSRISQSGGLRNARFIMQHAISNLGSMLGVICCSMVGEKIGWQFAFIMAGLSEIFIFQSMIRYLQWRGFRDLIVKTIRKASMKLGVVLMVVPASALLLNYLYFLQLGTVIAFLVSLIFGYRITQNMRVTKTHIAFIVYMMFFQILFMSMYGQGFSSLVIFCDKLVDKQIFGIELPTTFFQIIDPMFTLGLGVMLSLSSSKIRGYSESYTKRLYAAGFITLSLGFSILAYGCMARETLVHPLYLVVAIGCFVVASLFVVPAGKAMITELSPDKSQGVFFGIWMLSMAVGEILSGKISKLTDFSEYRHLGTDLIGQHYLSFFLFLSVIAASGYFILNIGHRFLLKDNQKTKEEPLLIIGG